MWRIECTPEETRVLYYISSSLLEADNPNVFASLAEFIGEELDLAGCSIWRRDYGVQAPERLGFYQRQGEVILDYLPSLDYQVAYRVVESGEVLVENSVGKMAGVKAGSMCPALIALPLTVDGNTGGALCLWVDISPHVDTVSLYMAREMARLLAVGLRQQKNLCPAPDHDKDNAPKVIENSIPPGALQPLPVITGVSLGVRSLELNGRGGDFYDLAMTKGKCLSILLGGMMGKDILALSWKQAARLVLKMMAGNNVPPGRACSDLNELLYDELHLTGILLGCIYACYNPLTRNLVYSNAGYSAPVIIKGETGQVIPGSPSETFIGHTKTVSYSEHSLRLNTGDIVVFCSNGVSELLGETGEIYSWERIGQTLRKYHYYNAPSLLDCLALDISQFLGGRRPLEHITLAVLKVE